MKTHAVIIIIIIIILEFQKSMWVGNRNLIINFASLNARNGYTGNMHYQTFIWGFNYPLETLTIREVAMGTVVLRCCSRWAMILPVLGVLHINFIVLTVYCMTWKFYGNKIYSLPLNYLDKKLTDFIFMEVQFCACCHGNV